MSSEALYARNRTPCCQPPIQQTAVANQCQALVSAPRADSSARQSVHSMCMLKHLKKGGGGHKGTMWARLAGFKKGDQARLRTR